MVVFLIKIIFFAISTISNLISRLIFNATANLIVLIVQGFRIPGEAVQGALEQVAEVIKACFEYMLGLIMEAISTLISSAFDLLVDSVTGSVAVTGSAIGGLAEKTRTSLEGLLTGLPELVGGFSEMITTVISDLWNNCLEAVGYVAENV